MRLVVCILCVTALSGILLSQDNTKDWSEYIEVLNEKRINTEQTEFSPSYWENNIVFVKAKPRKKLLDKKQNEPFYDLHFSESVDSEYLTKDKNLSTTINTIYHEGPATFDESAAKMYFTRVDYDGKEVKMNKEKLVLLKIYESTFAEGSWSKPKQSEFNESELPSCHPSLSRDGKSMIFASERPGGYGKMDLYITTLKGDSWSEPKNLGPHINSTGNDWFPYLDEKGYLFFASESSSSKKDLDIYMARPITDEKWTDPVSLPKPINTSYDDFGLIIKQKGQVGFLSSNRPGGSGKDDIYSFMSFKSLYAYEDEGYNQIEFSVMDRDSKTRIDKALITTSHLSEEELLSFGKDLFDLPHLILDSIYTNDQGTGKITLDESYTLVNIQYEGKKPWQLVLSNEGAQKFIDVLLEDIPAQKIIQPEIIYVEKEVPAPTINNVTVDVGAVIILEHIYYDYNSASLTKGAKSELNKLARLMKENPSLKIQLSAHTDSRGQEAYNQDLSQRRAQSAKLHLSTQGVPSSKIVAIGYGESQLRNHCRDGVFCTEAEHIYNRRTEVKILEK